MTEEKSPHQMHGVGFEGRIKSANGIFSNAAANRKRGPNDLFDLRPEDDVARGLPTSIKSTGSDGVGLSDARNFWQSLDCAPYRILVGSYSQEDGIKIFHKIDELIILEKYREKLLGGISLATVIEFHDGIRKHGPGRDGQAKAIAWARAFHAKIMPDLGLVKLNRKIDSRNQRRLQCSISLKSLLDLVSADGGHTVHDDFFGNLVLPIHIKSGRRQFSK